jgi:hypothetical protein
MCGDDSVYVLRLSYARNMLCIPVLPALGPNHMHGSVHDHARSAMEIPLCFLCAVNGTMECVRSNNFLNSALADSEEALEI